MHDRAARILEEVLNRGRVPVALLAGRFRASPATIRRDLAALEQKGLLRRSHGAAMASAPVVDQDFRRDSGFQEQMSRMAEAKRRIGVLAAKQVEDGQVIAFGAGTTTTQTARALRSLRGVTVVTNSLGIALELARRDDLRIFVTGGYLHGGWFSLTGAHAIEAVRGFCIDLLFLSVSAIDPSRGLMESHTEEASLNRALLGQSRRKIVVADHTKIGKTAAHVLCPLDQIDRVITDVGAPKRTLSALRRKGVEVATA